MSFISAAFGLAACLVLPGPADNETAADVITLRDGRTLAGELIEPWNPGSVGLYVRRDWVRKNLPDWADRWEAADAPLNRRAVLQRRERLEAWRRDRVVDAPDKEDRITPWIDRELTRLRGGGDAGHSRLLVARLTRNDVRSVSRTTQGLSRLLRLGWLSGFPAPETMSVGDLKDALEGRAYDVSEKTPVPIDALLPPRVEADSAWMIRRAATEVSFDAGLKLIRHQGLVMSETEPGQLLNAGGAMAGLSALKELLGENPGDPLIERLRGFEKRGRVGALVTKLDVAPDLSGVSVEIALWVRQGPDRWTPAGSRSSRVRPEELGPDAGKDLADDPQVARAFQLVEALGLGQAAQDLKQRSLSIGAATRKALGLARTAANADLARLALPVLDAPREAKPADGDPQNRGKN